MLKNIISIKNSDDKKYKILTILWKEFYIQRYLLKLKLFMIKKQFPKTMSITETVEYILYNKCSISRFGDGEYNLLMGKGLGEYQIYDETLVKRLREIVSSQTEKCLIGIVHPKEQLVPYWQIHFVKNYKKYRKYLNKNIVYGNALISRTNGFRTYGDKYTESIKRLWDSQKTLFVVGNGSRFIFEDKLFDNCQQIDLLVVKGKSSFSDYSTIFSQITKYDKDWKIILCLGPTATVLAYDLSNLGYQALDLGHLPNCYRKWKGEAVQPEFSKETFDKEYGLYHIK